MGVQEVKAEASRNPMLAHSNEKVVNGPGPLESSTWVELQRKHLHRPRRVLKLKGGVLFLFFSS